MYGLTGRSQLISSLVYDSEIMPYIAVQEAIGYTGGQWGVLKYPPIVPIFFGILSI